MKRLLAVVCCAGLVAFPGRAATYYLDAVDGLDSQDGSAGAPWRTLAKAQAVLAAGDSAVLATGNYGAFADVQVSEDRTDWIDYVAGDGAEPVFTSMVVSNAYGGYGPVDFRVRFRGITVTREAPDPMPVPDGSRLSGNYTRLVLCEDAHHVRMYGCRVIGFEKYLSSGVRFNLCDSVVFERCEVATTLDGVRFLGCAYPEIRGCRVHNLSEGSGISIRTGCTGALVYNNHVHDCNYDTSDTYFPYDGSPAWHQGTGLAVRSSGTVIRNNIVHDGFSQALMFYTDDGGTEHTYNDMLVENNLFYDGGRVGFYNMDPDADHPVVIRNNTFCCGYLYVDGTGKYDILQRYKGTAMQTSLYGDNDGTGFQCYNNIVVGPFGLPDMALDYAADYNIYWLHGDYLENGKGAHSHMAVWRDGDTPYALHGNPNYFEDIGFTGATDEYSFADDGVRPFFENPGFRFSGDYTEDRHRSDLDFRPAAGSPAVGFGDPDQQPATSLGTLDADGFILENGIARDADHHTAGCYEYGTTSGVHTDDRRAVLPTAFSFRCPEGAVYDLLGRSGTLRGRGMYLRADEVRGTLRKMLSLE